MTDDLVIDNLTPAESALLLERRDNIMYKHGGICTKIGFSSVEAMTPEAFIRDVVPKLKDNNRDSLIVMRAPVDGHVTMIYGDSILRYNLTRLEEADLETVANEIKKTSEIMLELNLPWPLVWIGKYSTHVGCIVDIPSTKFRYRNIRLGLQETIYSPPMWFCCDLSLAGNPMTTKVFAVPKRSLYWKDTELMHMPLNNVGSGGNICFGTTSMTGGISHPDIDKWQTALINNFQLFLESDYNTDLGGAWSSNSSTEKAWETWQKKHPGEADKSLSGVARVTKILTDPEGWKWLEYTGENVTPGDIVQEFSK